MGQPLVRRTIYHAVFLVIFAIAIGALLRDHAALPVGKAPPLLMHGATTYEGIHHLSGAETPFLRQGGTQAIWWFGWQREAFATAMLLERPILLYIGAAWSETSQYLDEVTFHDATLADLINHRMIPIRVDLEASPDIDARYRLAARVIGGGHSDAVVLFLTPTGDPFFAADAIDHGEEAWETLPTLVESVADFFARQPNVVEANASGLRGQLQAYFMSDWVDTALPKISTVNEYIAATASQFDRTSGGFRDQVGLWPDPTTLGLYLRIGADPARRDVLQMAVQGLRAMVRSALYDHVDGGFFRGARDTAWRAPYVGKRLIINAELLRLYIDAYQLTGETEFRRIAEETTDYLLAHLYNPEQEVFMASELLSIDDATWSEEELLGLFTGPERQVVQLRFALAREPRLFPDRPFRNALAVGASLDAIAQRLGWSAEKTAQIDATIRERLRDARRERRAIPRDESAYADANGVAIQALFHASMRLDLPKAGEIAQHVLRHWVRKGVDRLGVRHALVGDHPNYLLADQTAMLEALLTAYEATHDQAWWREAMGLVHRIEQYFGSEILAGFYDRPQVALPFPLHGLVQVPVRPYFDFIGAPSNPRLAKIFDQLSYRTGDEDWRITADGILLGLAGIVQEGMNRSMASYMSAVLLHHRPPVHVIILGTDDAKSTAAFERAARRGGGVDLLLDRVSPRAAVPYLSDDVRHLLPQIPASHGGAAIFCRGTVCSPPIVEPRELLRQLRQTSG